MALLEEIVDDVSRHYFDSASLSSTELSAAHLNTKLKRLGARVRELPPSNSSDSAELSGLLIQMRNLVSLPDDFQDPSRAIRPSGDPILENVQSCEESIKRNLRKARKSR